MEAIKPKQKGLKRIAKIGQDHLYLKGITLVLIIITLLCICQCQRQIYLINDFNAETLTNGRMISRGQIYHQQRY